MGERLTKEGFSPEEAQKYSSNRFPFPQTQDFVNLEKKTIGKLLPEDFIENPRNRGEKVLDFVASNIPSMGKALVSGPMAATKALAKPALSA